MPLVMNSTERQYLYGYDKIDYDQLFKLLIPSEFSMYVSSIVLLFAVWKLHTLTIIEVRTGTIKIADIES
jgi:hypothetical protein